MSGSIVVSPIAVRTARNAEAFSVLLGEASVDPSIHYILYLLNNHRQFLFGFKRSSNNIVSIFYDNLDRGLPAARDIKDVVIGSMSRETRFVDVSLMKKLRHYFDNCSEVSATTIGIFSKAQEKIEMTPELIAELQKEDVNAESFLLALRDFSYFSKFEKGHKYYPIPTLGEMVVQLESDAVELQDVNNSGRGLRFAK